VHESDGIPIPRKRYRVFAFNFCLNVLEHGMDKDQAIVAAAREAWPRLGKGNRTRGPAKDSAMLNRGLDALDSDEVQSFVHAQFQEAGLNFAQMIQTHVDHIKGNITREVLGKDGEKVSLREAPNYQALKDAETLVLPPRVQKQEIRSFNVSMGGGAAPTVRARKTVKEITGGTESE
jgi:hypothetical protein